MSDNDWTWNGARWWKFDFHTHTPASDDYGKGAHQGELLKRTPRDWLLDYMRAGIDCIAVTDHNSGVWVERLQTTLSELDSEQPADYRPVFLFPGVELRVSGGIHLLVILESGATSADIDSLLGAVGFTGQRGKSDSETSKSLADVIDAVVRRNGLAIAAHVDEVNGLFKLQGVTLKEALDLEGIRAVEVVDPTSARPPAFSAAAGRFAEVLGSDSHHPAGTGPRYPGSHFTWVKMGEPSLDGLRLALLDRGLSVQRSDSTTDDPNLHAASVIEEIGVSDARFMGRESRFTVRLSPWLTAVVGGRGTGKSSLIEFSRLALDRADDLPGPLREEVLKYREVYQDRRESGLLTYDSKVEVIYRRDSGRFRLSWTTGGEPPVIEEELAAGGWRQSQGSVASRFPVRIYSQKQVFQMASAPLALLRVVDEAPEVNRSDWLTDWHRQSATYLSIRAQQREVESQLEEEPRLLGELEDVLRKIAVFEGSGHTQILSDFQRRARERTQIDTWRETWRDLPERLTELADDMVPPALAGGEFVPGEVLTDSAVAVAEAARQELTGLSATVREVAARVTAAGADFDQALAASAWAAAEAGASVALNSLRDTLSAEDAGAPDAYTLLVNQRQRIESRVSELGELRAQGATLQSQAHEVSRQLQLLRTQLTERRVSFLSSVLDGNPYVTIDLIPYGNTETVEADLREVLQRTDGGFERDIGKAPDDGLLGRLFSHPHGVVSALAEVREGLRALAVGSRSAIDAKDQRFANHLSKLPPEAFDRLDIWYPEDALEVRYSPRGDGKDFRPIREGSPGQRTAALLAFLLAYGEEPLLLDQPEDDLENRLIYDLIVAQIRQVKKRRQVIVVTHNSNIVVNGDAELVVALEARGGQTHIECEGSLQSGRVRETVCSVMEGGREAFEQRYRRIALGA